jgi:antitoxin VapB
MCHRGRERREADVVVLYIENREAEQLARDVAALTGESVTSAVAQALRERLVRLRAEPTAESSQERVEALLALAQDIAPRLQGEFAQKDHGDLLYDEVGLPACAPSN